jgi:phage/plasmid-like protein (TIGR03299 family)
MSDFVTQRADGSREAAFNRKPPWWDRGYKCSDHAMTSEEIQKVAQIDWLVEQHPIFIHRVEEVDGKPITVHQQIPGQLANIRSDNQFHLGNVSEKYKVVQNKEAFDFVDQLHMDGIVKYESAGSLKGGKFVWMLAKMPQEFEVVAGDKLEQYILFTTAHDGSRAVRVMPTSVRVVCWNTLSLATANESKGLSIRHKGNIFDKLADAKKCIMTAKDKFNRFHEKAQRLTEVAFDIEQLEALTKLLIPREKGKNDTRRAKARASIMAAFTDDPQNIDGVRGTAWAAFNAITQHVDHESGYKGKNTDAKAEARMESVLFGANARFKTNALKAVAEVAEAMSA